MRTELCSWAAIAFLLVAVGCTASPARPEAMVPTAFDIVNRHSFDVSVRVAGGSETDPLWTSQISDVHFKQAVETSIEQSGVFRGVRPEGGGTYLVEIMLLDLDEPLIGFNMTVEMLARWGIVHLATNEQVWAKEFQSSHTASVSDEFVAAERIRFANEGAARSNIAQALAEISRLTFR